MTSDDSVVASRTERKKEETKQKIIAAAVKLFRQQGFDAATMEQIAEEADIAKGTLYNYFPVKEAILSEYIRRSFREKNARRIEQLQALPDTHARMVSVLTELISGIATQKEIYEKYLTYQLRNILSLQKTERERSGIEQLAGTIIRLGQESGEIRSDLPVGILEDQFDFVFIEIAKQMFIAEGPFDAGPVIEGCVDLFLNGIKKAG